MNLEIDTVQVEKISTTMAELVQRYQSEYQEVYTNATEMGQYWNGEAKTTYMQKLDGFRNDFEKMVRVLSNYSEKLGVIARRYNQAEDAAKNLASKLSIGN